MKRVATTSERPVVVPVVVVAVDVHVALVVPPVERGVAYVQYAILPTARRVLSGLYRIRHLNALAYRTKYLRFLQV